MSQFDVILIGSGLAGLRAALLGAAYGDILLLTKARLEDSNTMYAQGGIAAALEHADSPDLHYRDTISAGDGLCEPHPARVLVDDGPSAVRDLIALGVPFDRENGQIQSTREAAHSYPRILHAGGDATGERIETTVADLIRHTPRVTVKEHTFVLELLANNGRINGVRAIDLDTGRSSQYTAGAVVLATGGAGQLYSQTTNPTVATGDGVTLAFKAGAAIADIEFVQFHPTALALPEAPRFLISEAVRGEGGILRNRAGERFMPRYDERAELAPRDVVARSIVFELERTGGTEVYLDVTHLGDAHFRRRFPTISRVCAEFGIDVGRDPIPVSPAAHYFMGGVLTNSWAQSTLPGLYACGECACTGVHGANRLASNSLLEALVFSSRAIQHYFSRSIVSKEAQESSGGKSGQLDPPLLARLARSKSAATGTATVDELRSAMWQHAGLIRNDTGLKSLLSLAAPPDVTTSGTTKEEFERQNLLTLGHLVATAARLRTESRGAHFRIDYPSRGLAWRRHIALIAPQNLIAPWTGGAIRWGAVGWSTSRRSLAGVSK